MCTNFIGHQNKTVMWENSKSNYVLDLLRWKWVKVNSE